MCLRQGEKSKRNEQWYNKSASYKLIIEAVRVDEIQKSKGPKAKP